MSIFTRSHTNIKWDKKSPLIFQAISWHAEDVDYMDILGETDLKKDCNKYTIKVFGSTLAGETVSLSILNFLPYFYIKVPASWQKSDLDMRRNIKCLQDCIRQSLRNPEVLLQARITNKQDFWGFSNFEDFVFVKLSFANIASMRKIVHKFENKVAVRGVSNCSIKFEIYESNIDPYIRFMHLQNIVPTGWIRVMNGKYGNCQGDITSNCNIDMEAKYMNVLPYAENNTLIAPFLVASFDIECTSFTGDFPVPIKSYRKLICELYDLYHKLDQNKVIEYRKCRSILIGIMYALGIPLQQEDDIIDKTLLESMITKVHPKNSDFNHTYIINQVKEKTDEIVMIFNGNMPMPLPRQDKAKQDKMTEGKEPDVKPDKKPTRDERITWLDEKINRNYIDLPQLKGDPVIQIGTTFHRYGETKCSFKHIVTLGTCEPIDGVVVEECESESDLLMRWRDLIIKTNPDIITGYNIFGFDFSYITDRAMELGVFNGLLTISRIKSRICQYKIQKLSSSALGDNILKFIEMPGRVLIDLMKVIQRDHKLDSYKLDLVGQHFLNMRKNDVSPQQINSLQKGTAGDRKIIADYCVQDCTLCNHLMMKLEILANNMGMSNVCLVPLSFIFMRGQGIKIFSLVLKECLDQNVLIPVKKPKGLPPWQKNDFPKYFVPRKIEEEEEEVEDSFEGAIVLEPKEGIYIDHPVSVVDYASLYPSSMISENLSHDCIVIDPKYDNLPGVEYLDIAYDIYEGVGDKKKKTGNQHVCRFVQLPNGDKGIIPTILNKLLIARKETRKKIGWQLVETRDGSKHVGLFNKDGSFNNSIGETIVIAPSDIVSQCDNFNEFQKVIFDGLQSAYKVTANSLYGQIGAKTSPIYLKDIAACTTATGRKMIMMAKDFLETKYNANIIYGDTDSIFIIFPDSPDIPESQKTGRSRIMPSIEKSIIASKEFKKIIKAPHDLEYEKTFWPFMLLSKKRYVGNLYEFDDTKFKQKSMGIVLKRRDNAQIVKHVYGGVIDIILNKHDILESIEFLKVQLNNLIKGKVDISDLVISKQLKSDYKDPTRIAHKVLAERIGERDPGNKPQSSDRIQYVYVKQNIIKTAVGKRVKTIKILQGERIESPEYMQANNLTPDYGFYITNQLMKPLLQVFAIVLHDIPGSKIKKADMDDIYQNVLLDSPDNPKKAREKFTTLKEKEVERLLFEPVLNALLLEDVDYKVKKPRKNKTKKIMDYYSHVKT